MCLQCSTNSSSYGEFTEKFTLHISEIDHPEWPVGWVGLVQMNDPTFVFPVPPQNPRENRTDDEMTEDLWDKEIAYYDWCRSNFKYQNPNQLLSLYEDCRKAGYNYANNDFEVWVFDRIYHILTSRKGEKNLQGVLPGQDILMENNKNKYPLLWKL